jgi:ligand-binding sensor protein/AraC-like DNA-binding protein
MSSAPGSILLRSGERELFVEEFEKDLHFLQLFMVLMNRSCPIRNLDLVWTEIGPTSRAGWRHLGITEALGCPSSRLFQCAPGNPHPEFCNLINDYGVREAASCALSDKAAEERVARTGKASVYRCHFGLTDIAVPVVANGHHIATLFSGQVLTEQPNEAAFDEVRKAVGHLEWVNTDELRRAYWNTVVVTHEDVQRTVEMLEVFASYIATVWQRLYKAVQQDRQHHRELEIVRKEFAYLVLEQDQAGIVEAGRLLPRLGMSGCPNRVLVIRGESNAAESMMVNDRALTTVTHVLDELSGKLDHCAYTLLRGQCICLFLRDSGEGRRLGGDMKPIEIAETVLRAVAARCAAPVRIGIGGMKEELGALAESYNEANVALAASSASIAVYRGPSAPAADASKSAWELAAQLAEGKHDEAQFLVASLPLQAGRQFGGRLPAQRQFLLSAIAALYATALKLGCDPNAIGEYRKTAESELAAAEHAFDLQRAFVRGAEAIVFEVQDLYSDKSTRLVRRACRIVERSLAEREGSPLSQREVATALGISPSHLNRLFKRVTGNTFERELMHLRIRIAKRLLLDPAIIVYMVSLQ